MRLRADLLHHVELPYDVSVELTGELLIFVRSVVLAIAEALSVEAHHLTSIRDVIKAVTFDERRGAYALKGPIIDAPGSELLVGLLPQKRAVRLTKAHQHTSIAALLRVPHRFIISADVDLPACDYRITVALRAECGDPLDVLLGLEVPTRGHPFLIRDHVPVGRPAPHRPVTVAGIGS